TAEMNRGGQAPRPFEEAFRRGGGTMTWLSAATARLTLTTVALCALVLCFYSSNSGPAQAQGLKSYDSNKKEFWTKPPDDWFLGDETEQQKGQAPNPGQRLPTPLADLANILGTIKLP